MLSRRSLLAFLGISLSLLLPGGAHAADPARIQDVIYLKKAGVALTLDVFKPEKQNGIGLLWMVSGGWVSNHANINPQFVKPFTDRGVTVFAVVHGAQPRYKVFEIVEDIHRAVRFVRSKASEYGVDPNRLAISGASAGGHLSLMMGAYGGPGKTDARDSVDRESSAVQAVACFFPPTDFLNYGGDGQSAMKIDTLKAYWPAFGVTEATPDAEREQLARQTSPIYGNLDKMPPTLIIHGDADKLVPIQQSERLIAELKKRNVDCKLEVRPGKAHGWPELPQDLNVLAEWVVAKLGKA